MAGEFASGLFALGGATVGGLTSYFATAHELRGQREEASQARSERLAGVRRVQYVDLVQRGDLLTDALRELHELTSPDDASEATVRRYESLWESFVQASTAVEMAGPASLAEAAREFHRSTPSLCNLIDAWRDGKRWTSADRHAYIESLDRKKAARSAFVASAHHAVSLDA